MEHPTSNEKGIGVKEQDLAPIMEGTRHQKDPGTGLLKKIEEDQDQDPA